MTAQRSLYTLEGREGELAGKLTSLDFLRARISELELRIRQEREVS